jgi:hypothetical protein
MRTSGSRRRIDGEIDVGGVVVGAQEHRGRRSEAGLLEHLVVGRVADEDLVRDRREPPRDRGVLFHDMDGQPATLERGGGGTSHPSAADH